LALSSPNNLYPKSLYRGVVSEANNNLFYLGAQDQWFTFNMFDAQAWYVRDVILGDAKLPSEAEQKLDMAQWTQRLENLGSAADEVRFQADYIRDLIEQTDYPMFDLDEVTRIFLAWKNDKQHNILNYRDQVYRSVMTGTMACEHHTPWLRELDDSLERYLSQPEEDELERMVRGKDSSASPA